MKRKGWTLIEFMVVVSILAILIAIIWPIVTGQTSRRIKATTERATKLAKVGKLEIEGADIQGEQYTEGTLEINNFEITIWVGKIKNRETGKLVDHTVVPVKGSAFYQFKNRYHK